MKISDKEIYIVGDDRIFTHEIYSTDRAAVQIETHNTKALG